MERTSKRGYSASEADTANLFFTPGEPKPPALADAARNMAQLAEQAHILSLLYDIGRELTSILDMETLLRAVGEGVKRLVDYDVFGVLLLEPESRKLKHEFSLRYNQRIHPKTNLELGMGLCGAAALERRPIRVNRVNSDPRYIQCEEDLGVESELVVPLIVQDRLLGVLDIESTTPDAFSESHEQTVATLASTVAIAIENAHLYEQLRRAEQRKTEDLERAREVQLLLLPSTMPQKPGIEIAVRYLPANELGGDFYDFLAYPEGRLAIAVGDVAGKGSAAALLASLGVGILREHAVHSPSPPAEMLSDLNGHLQIPGRDGRFIAMVFSVYDPYSRELTVANAGFPQPLLVRDKHAVPISVTGVPLGILEDTRYESITLRLEPGDVVVFCSDGIHEQTNSMEEEFGIERLISRLAEVRGCVSAEQIAGDILRAIDEHAGRSASCPQYNDDRTIAVLRVTGGPDAC